MQIKISRNSRATVGYSALALPAAESTKPCRSDEALREMLVGLLSEHFRERCEIVELERRISPYSTSFTLEEIDLVLDRGLPLRLMMKDLRWDALLGDAQRIRPQFMYDSHREIHVYDRILRHTSLAPEFYGAILEENGPHLLFLERVNAEKLCHVGSFTAWTRVAQWLADCHAKFANCLPPSDDLIDYGAGFFGVWVDRAMKNLRVRDESAKRRLQFDRLAKRYLNEGIDQLSAMPHTFIHGEFYASNVLVTRTPRGHVSRVCPVDWELAARGPGMVDLAALVAGNWTRDQREAMARAYTDRVESLGAGPVPFKQFVRDLNLCRLHLAIQWVGWATDWQPPSDQAQDWLSDALHIAAELGWS